MDITSELRADAAAHRDSCSGSIVTAVIEDQAADEISRLRSLLDQGRQQILLWATQYGKQQPEWLPPAGDVQWLECVSDALKGTPWERK